MGILKCFVCLVLSTKKHRSALRGTPGSACPQPEPNATKLPSCAPISARDAQRRRRRRWWHGDEGARRPGPEAQVLRHVLWHALRNALRNCAASLACSSFTRRLGEAWGAVEHDACHDEHLYASVLRATGGLVLPGRFSLAVRCELQVPRWHHPHQARGQEGGQLPSPCVGAHQGPQGGAHDEHEACRLDSCGRS